MPDIEYLKKLALIGAVNKTIKVSSSEFQKHTGESSKTAARKLKQLEEEGLIERKIVPGGQLIRMTEKGKEDFKVIKLEVSQDMRGRIEKLDEQKLNILSNSTQQVRDILSEIMTDSHSTSTTYNKN